MIQAKKKSEEHFAFGLNTFIKPSPTSTSAACPISQNQMPKAEELDLHWRRAWEAIVELGEQQR